MGMLELGIMTHWDWKIKALGGLQLQALRRYHMKFYFATAQ
jgi:hypothetical protein